MVIAIEWERVGVGESGIEWERVGESGSGIVGESPRLKPNL